MEIIVKVQIDISEDTKAFVAALFGNQNKAEKPLWMQKQEETIKDLKEKVPPITGTDVKVVKSTDTKSTDTKVVKPVDTKPVDTKPADTKVTGTKITLADVRAKTAPLVEVHRQAIMEKLRELGAANVSSLKEEHFPTFITFLDTLK